MATGSQRSQDQSGNSGENSTDNVFMCQKTPVNKHKLKKEDPLRILSSTSSHSSNAECAYPGG